MSPELHSMIGRSITGMIPMGYYAPRSVRLGSAGFIVRPIILFIVGNYSHFVVRPRKGRGLKCI